jgi:hypothetical protein
MVLQLGLLWPCPQILRPDWKGFPRVNPLAYSAAGSVRKKKKLSPGVGGDLQLLLVDSHSDLGVLAALLGGGEQDGGLAEEDLDLALVLLVLHVPGEDAVGTAGGAVAGELEPTLENFFSL